MIKFLKCMVTRETVGSLAWGIGLLVLAFGADFARRHGYLDDETVRRLVIGASGLMIVWFGNRMPKTFVPNAQARKARRFGGWSLTLSGLVYVGLWGFAPMPVASIGGTAAVLLGIAATLGYCLTLRGRAKAA